MHGLANRRRLLLPTLAALLAAMVAAQPDGRGSATLPPAGVGSAERAAGPVYYLVGGAEGQRALAATLALAAEDRVIVIAPGMDADEQLFALAAVNHRRMDGGQPPIVVRDLRKHTP